MTKFSGSQQSQLAQIGAFLREKREQQGKSLQDIATNTYIRPQLLSGIETGNPELLPEPIFVQGFIRRYAETLGLKGVELSQQFTVDSIPSTPRLTKPIAPEDSSTTRLTRLNPKTGSQLPEMAPAASAASREIPSEEVPIFAEETTPAPQRATAADITVVPLTSEVSNEPNVFDFTSSSELGPAISSPETDIAETYIAETDVTAANIKEENGTVENGTVENGTVENGTVENSLSETTIESGSDPLPVLETAGVGSEKVELGTTVATAPDDEPSPFASDLPLAKETPNNGQLTTSPITYTPTTSLSSVSLSDRDTPNLKPFAIGAVVIAALTAGVVVLANFIGREPIPTVADAPEPVESVEPEVDSALPTLPEPAPVPTAEPAVSDAPLFLQVEVTETAWTSVIADGSDRLFEGTLNPGDSLVWEAQNSINVYSGNPGGLEISQNGQPAQPLGESGIPAEKDYSIQ